MGSNLSKSISAVHNENIVNDSKNYNNKDEEEEVVVNNSLVLDNSDCNNSFIITSVEIIDEITPPPPNEDHNNKQQRNQQHQQHNIVNKNKQKKLKLPRPPPQKKKDFLNNDSKLIIMFPKIRLNDRLCFEKSLFKNLEDSSSPFGSAYFQEILDYDDDSSNSFSSSEHGRSFENSSIVKSSSQGSILEQFQLLEFKNYDKHDAEVENGKHNNGKSEGNQNGK